MDATSCLHCAVCHGKGPSPTYRLDERGDLIPVPFVPCVGCGLDWPTAPSTPSPSISSLPFGMESAIGCYITAEQPIWTSA